MVLHIQCRYTVRMYDIPLKIFIPIVLAWAVTSNVLLMVVLIKFPKLVQPNNLIIRKVIISLDITFVSAVGTLNLFVLYYGNNTPTLLCNYLTYIAGTLVVSQCLTLTVMAIERYVYVVHPLKYNQMITKGRIVAGLLSCILLPTCFTVASEPLIERRLSLKSLMCTSDETIVNLCKMLLFIIPSFCCTIGISVSLWKLTRKINSTNDALFKPQVQKNFRLIAFISGCLWMTYIPGAVLVAIANVLLSTSSEYHDVAVYLYLITSIVVSYASSSINPVLQFYVDKDLWIAAKKLCGKRVYFSFQKEYLEGIVSGRTDTMTV